MQFDVYCDESYPDLFSSKHPQGKYLVIGSLWLPTEKRAEYKTEIHTLRDKHKVGGEFKWNKVTPSRIEFYQDLIEWFFSKGLDLRFRCIVVDTFGFDLCKYHDDDQELGFYKFYYQLLHHWIVEFNRYSIFCDYKMNRKGNRLSVLKDCLTCSHQLSRIGTIQSVKSEESVLIQLVDVLIGITSAKYNHRSPGNAKDELIAHFEALLKRKISATSKGVEKHNVFCIDLRGSW